MPTSTSISDQVALGRPPYALPYAPYALPGGARSTAPRSSVLTNRVDGERLFMSASRAGMLRSFVLISAMAVPERPVQG